MADVTIAGTTYPDVETVALTNTDGETVLFGLGATGAGHVDVTLDENGDIKITGCGSSGGGSAWKKVGEVASTYESMPINVYATVELEDSVKEAILYLYMNTDGTPNINIQVVDSDGNLTTITPTVHPVNDGTYLSDITKVLCSDEGCEIMCYRQNRTTSEELTFARGAFSTSVKDIKEVRFSAYQVKSGSKMVVYGRN